MANKIRPDTAPLLENLQFGTWRDKISTDLTRFCAWYQDQMTTNPEFAAA